MKLRDAGSLARSVVFLSGGGQFLSATDDGTIDEWDVQTGTSMRIGKFVDRPTSMALAPLGRHVAIGLENGETAIIRLPNLFSGAYDMPRRARQSLK